METHVDTPIVRRIPGSFSVVGFERGGGENYWCIESEVPLRGAVIIRLKSAAISLKCMTLNGNHT